MSFSSLNACRVVTVRTRVKLSTDLKSLEHVDVFKKKKDLKNLNFKWTCDRLNTGGGLVQI